MRPYSTIRKPADEEWEAASARLPTAAAIGPGSSLSVIDPKRKQSA
jgi:hypothetical protein